MSKAIQNPKSKIQNRRMGCHADGRLRRHDSCQSRTAFTLIELLVVVAILALLVALLLPGLSAARRSARRARCAANLHSIMTAVHAYAAGNQDLVVPSYTMSGYFGGTANPFEGWAPILDQARLADGSHDLHGHVFACPDALDVAGVENTQTGGDPDNPKGYMDWPSIITFSRNYGTTIPARGFNQIIRVSYWINAENPLGRLETVQPGRHFSASVGYGPDSLGHSLPYCVMSAFKTPARLIAFADGLYAGKQEVTRLGENNERIGYRHAGPIPTANVAFADGHVSVIDGLHFPRRVGGAITIEQAREENFGGGPTVYADPQRALGAE